MSSLLGIDIGTTATKVVLLDPDIGVIAETDRPSRLISDEPTWAEEDPSEWWRNVCEICLGITSEHEISAIAVSGMVPCVILLDESGKLLRRSIQQNDARATDEITKLQELLSGANILERTGSPITQQSVAPKLLWISKHEKEKFVATRTIFGSYDYITYRLTGNRTVEHNWALESGLYDVETKSWATDVLSVIGLKDTILPDIFKPGETAGSVSRKASQETGIQEGTPVIIGSADHVASAFAAGAIHSGDVVVKLGGAGDILFSTNFPIVDKRLYLDYHIVPGKFLPNGCMATSGSLIRWFQKELAGGAPLEQLDLEAEEAGPGAGGVVATPYFLGEKTPLNDPTARGAFVGLHLGHRRGHLFRAILEAISFGFKHHMDVFADLGHFPQRIRVTDGGTKSRLWTQITADILGFPLEKVKVTGGSAFGAAFAAGMGVGTFSEWSEIEKFVSIVEVIENSQNELYREPYQVFRMLYPTLKEMQAKLTAR